MGFEIDQAKLFKLIGYVPHPKQALFHASHARYRIPVCGVRWGKSYAAAVEILKELLKPERRLWIVGPTYDLGEKEFRYVWDFYHRKLKLTSLPGSNYKPKQGKMRILTPMNSVVEVRSAQHPKHLDGEALDGVCMSEAAKHSRSVWEFHLRERLTDRKGWAIFPSTPEGYNWFYDMWDNGQNPNMPKWESWRFPTWTNPYIDAAEIEDCRSILSDHAFRQQYGAEFTALTGRVYKEFDDEVHVGSYPYNPNWPCWRVIDFGFTNPFACLDIQVDPQDRLYVVREYYVRGKIIDDHAEALLRSSIKYEGYGADDEDPEAIERLRRKGIQAVHLHTESIPSELELVRGQLKIRGDDKPGLFVDRGCKNTIEEFHMYRYPETRDLLVEKELPIDKYNHSMDCIRMFVTWKMDPRPPSKTSDWTRVPSRVDFEEMGV